MSIAVWLPDLHLAKVVHTRGNAMQWMGASPRTLYTEPCAARRSLATPDSCLGFLHALCAIAYARARVTAPGMPAWQLQHHAPPEFVACWCCSCLVRKLWPLQVCCAGRGSSSSSRKLRTHLHVIVPPLSWCFEPTTTLQHAQAWLADRKYSLRRWQLFAQIIAMFVDASAFCAPVNGECR